MTAQWTPSLATLRRALLYRAGLGLLLALLAATWGDSPPLDRLSLLDVGAAIGIVVATGLGVLYRLRTGGHPYWLGFSLVAGDFLATTLLVWFSGPIDGPLVFLYPLAVVSTSFLLGPGASYYGAAIAFMLQGSGYLVLGGPDLETAGQELVLNGLLLVALAALSDGLANRLHRHEVRAQRRDRDVRTLTDLAEQVLERVDSGLLVVDGRGYIQLSNPEGEHLLGEVKDPENTHLGHRLPALNRLFRDWKADQGPAGGELTTLIPEEEEEQVSHVVAYRFTPLGSHEGGTTLIHLYDLTEARERQHEQERTERLAALGRLSANLAHEIRNPLSAIQHAGQLLAEKGTDTRMTGIIQKEADRLNDWVETLLHHLRPPTGQARTLELEPLVANAARLLGSEGDSDGGGRLDWEVPSGLTACIDEGHLQQILWNLGVNAIRHGGTVDGEGSCIRARAITSGATRIEILDRGPGIPVGKREQVFEPFYTTAARGTGLGLGLVRELVEANNGIITIEDRPDGGACIAVELPTQCHGGGKLEFDSSDCR
ncbi:sensor histidine kinase [Thiohalorhabdus sp.]|uniref:sensor histidine kinase n=1 Tax=Thiohalorhabdus sp. TaxID=3094134 RepID=UPI002FC2D101